MDCDIYISYMSIIIQGAALYKAIFKKKRIDKTKSRRSRRYKGRGRWQNSVIWKSYQDQRALLCADTSIEPPWADLPVSYQALENSGAFKFLKDAEEAQAAFRLRYRISHVQFEKLMVLIRERLDFSEQLDCTTRRETVAPLELKVMCVLRMLGRDSVLDDLEQMSGISVSTLNTFFRSFCAKITMLYDAFIDISGTSAAAADSYEFLPGCLGSVDGVHLWWDRVPFHLKNQYKGVKTFPSISFGVTANHAGRILSVTKGFQGSKNDKTVVRYDGFVKKLKQDPSFTSKTFELYNLQGEAVSHHGTYVICDNGYHNWRVLQSPISMASSYWDKQYSRFIESQRKDIECVFGRLKTRFLILKHPIRVLKHETVENIFFACCILHNLIMANGDSEKEVQWLENESMRLDTKTSLAVEGRLNTNESLAIQANILPRPQIVLSFESKGGEVEEENGYFKLRTALVNHFRYLVESKKLKTFENRAEN
mmetsp:Transcript_18917/g.32787  ORF Transcript_18917/g.32787 Transcript_18917/m.32787 type:complete len:482 (+) Transcript_18917:212-1657(+)